MKSAALVSVIIPAYQADRRLNECVAALARQTLPSNQFEIVIINNGPDASFDVRRPEGLNVRIVRESAGGSYQARNAGIADAQHDHLAFTDSDCLPGEGWLAAGLASLNAGHDLVGGRVELSFEDSTSLTIAESYERLTAFRQEKNVRKGFSVTANLFTRKSVFEAAGLFRADLFSGGDAEWCMRAVRGGARLGYSPDAVVVHPARREVGQLATKARRVIGGMLAHELMRRSRPSAVAHLVTRLLVAQAGFARLMLRAREPSLDLSARVRLMALQSYLLCLKLGELFRLAIGKVPERL